MSSTTVKGNALQFTNDNKHCYAYSGEFTADSTGVIRLTFTTDSYYVVGIMRFSGFTNMGSPAGSGQAGTCRVKFNDQTIACLATEGQTKDMPFTDTAELVIPPFTTVACVVDSASTQTDEHGSVGFTGRAYLTNRVGN